LDEKKKLTNKLNAFTQIGEETSKSGGLDGKKRHRRTATEISRHFKCPIEGCGKSYGSEGSLTQHIKNKHKEFNLSGYLASALGSSIGKKRIGGLPVANDFSESVNNEDEQKVRQIAGKAQPAFLSSPIN